MKMAKRPVPVSYTHLDVYKRQADALGNITRINNLLESYPEKLAEAEQRLETEMCIRDRVIITRGLSQAVPDFM